MEKTKEVAGVLVPEDLDINGFESGGHYEPKNDFQVNRINAARKVIAQSYVKMKTIQKDNSSYGLKHDMEKVIGEYMTNGEFIVAMIGEGFVFKRDRINCYFNVTATSVKQLRKTNEQLQNS
ncbi:hypothetical protein [Dyadobacter diqingensis]|uniref:hypothetical protein n=1 Tax=Dyadobacter diqingensis TaxID=2938121 RepID=UPI0020C4A1AC|nr:hypothetical protein [Dyadobacter diqingensis]